MDGRRSGTSSTAGRHDSRCAGRATTGFDNHCEDEAGYTHWYVLHAEANAILKVANSTQSCKGATLYITLSPCRECSKLIHQSGIQRVVYLNAYKDTSGVDFLLDAGVNVIQLEM